MENDHLRVIILESGDVKNLTRKANTVSKELKNKGLVETPNNISIGGAHVNRPALYPYLITLHLHVSEENIKEFDKFIREAGYESGRA